MHQQIHLQWKAKIMDKIHISAILDGKAIYRKLIGI